MEIYLHLHKLKLPRFLLFVRNRRKRKKTYPQSRDRITSEPKKIVKTKKIKIEWQIKIRKKKMNDNNEMKRMPLSDGKKNKSQSTKHRPPQRPSIVSNYSFVSLSEVTEGSLQVWRTLPEKIRQDPSLATFRQEHERLHGEFEF